MKPIIEVQHLIKSYKKAKEPAVDDISFCVQPGEFFAFLGPNGAGKTTTISILTTTLAKTSGVVTIDGYDADRQQSQVRQTIGVIFQNPSLDDNLTAEENIRFHAILYGLYPFSPTFSLMPASYKKRVHELAEILGIKKEIFKRLNTYSGGMKRKLEIVRGLMHQPKVLFLDEPTVGLDPLSRRNLWEYLRTIRDQEKTTIFLTTHYLDEAEDTDHICIINRGKIISFGTPEQIKKDMVKHYLVVDTPERTQLREELQSLNYIFVENEHVTIQLDGKSVQEMIKSIQAPLTMIQTHTPTLEDAYLEIISRDHQ